MNDDARLEWFGGIKIEIEMMNYELDDKRCRQTVRMVSSDVYCVYLQLKLTILDENDCLVFFPYLLA